jgi:ABC-2 type transport system permease protein
MNAMLWSIRRELWENRSLYLAPLGVAALAVGGFVVHTTRVRLSDDPAKLVEPYGFISLLLMATTFVVAIFYCLDALYGERRDRSVLFWKSMPVSDTTTVLSKAFIPIVLLPIATFVITIVTQFLVLALSSVVLMAKGQSAAVLWTKLPLLRMSWMLLYHLIAVHGLWYAPIYAWLLLVSSAVRRLPFLWAALPFVVLQVLEKIAFSTTRISMILQNRMGGGVDAAAFMKPMDAMPMHSNVLAFATDPGLWIGFVLTALFLWGAVRMRRTRGPI